MSSSDLSHSPTFWKSLKASEPALSNPYLWLFNQLRGDANIMERVTGIPTPRPAWLDVPSDGIPLDEDIRDYLTKWKSMLYDMFCTEGDPFLRIMHAKDVLRAVFSYAVPSSEALATIEKYSPIIELGAGTGYWAWLLQERGADVVAYDTRPPAGKAKNPWCYPFTYTQVYRGGQSVLRRGQRHRALMLCWPPHGEDMAFECLKAFQGTTLIYVGEGNGGCTANHKFFDLLRAQWRVIDEVSIPQWDCIRDSLSVWRRRLA